jgi:hypothetical protein
VNNVLPRADLWLCRDCFFHFSEHDIFLALDKYLKSDIAYILTSTHYCDVNSDTPTGEFRLLNLQLPPFSLGKPIRVRRRTPCPGNNPRAARCTGNSQLNERQTKERCSRFKRGATRGIHRRDHPFRHIFSGALLRCGGSAARFRESARMIV